MATLGIEIADAALVVARDGARVASQPGVALLTGAAIATGEAAAASQRLTPALANDRYWSDLATGSLARAEEPQVSHADLAHAQLLALWREAAQPGDDAAFALPATMRPQAIGLLLGIARHAGIPVAGLVDSGVAAAAGLAARATVLHLDVQLYQAVLTELNGESVLRRRRVETATRAGLKPMYSAWAQLVSEALVRRTRFDPLHQATTEQQLYQRLPGWLASLAARESVDTVIETEGGSFTAAIRREQFTLAAEAWYAQLAELVRGLHRADEPATLALSARAALLPALAERLGSLPGLEVVVLPDVAAAAGAAAHAGELGPADPPALVTALARAHPAAAGQHRRAVAIAATHVIEGGRAHAIGAEPIVVGAGAGAGPGRRIAIPGAGAGISRRHCTLVAEGGRAIVRDHSRYGTFVNGERVEGAAELGAGDRLRVGTPGVVLELVAVG
jgi:FHA domain